MVFPYIKGRPGFVNLGEYAIGWLDRHGYCPDDPNPLLNPHTCQAMVSQLHEELDIAYSYGGWLENRSVLWRGSYLDHLSPHVHLGVDLNVPEGTLVACDNGGSVLHVDRDPPGEEHGWGGRVFVRPFGHPGIVLVYAHLATIFVRTGESIKAGEAFAFVGAPERNGGWFPHLHVQALSNEAYKKFTDDPASLDGYGPASELPMLARLYPDPLRFLTL